MAIQEQVTHIQACPVFQPLPIEAQRLLAFSAESKVIPAGEVLFNKGDRGDAAFLNLRGIVSLDPQLGISRIEAREVGPGTLIDEIALIIETERPVKAVVVEDCQLLRISRNLFSRLMQEFPTAGQILAKRLKTRLDQNLAQIGQSIDTLARLS